MISFGAGLSIIRFAFCLHFQARPVPDDVRGKVILLRFRLAVRVGKTGDNAARIDGKAEEKDV